MTGGKPELLFGSSISFSEIKYVNIYVRGALSPYIRKQHQDWCQRQLEER